ncbi:MAG TPA: flavodoxin family protein [Candidatus Bariatricus faecipullorum]|nr:flavodoxin family protein [Candidatus Bariatricus faecipullorum]
MKIMVLEGSPNRHGSSNMLAEAFIRGAREAGHSVEVTDAAHAGIHPCTGCIHCGYEGPCAQKDEMEQIRPRILEADMLVFVTPLYYYGMSAQLKILIDRFCAFNSSIQRRHMKSALLAAAWNSDGWTFEALDAHYRTLVRYLNLEDMGEVLGAGCGTPSMTKHSGFVQQAYELGKSLK